MSYAPSRPAICSSNAVYNVGAISIGPGITCGEVGIIIVAWGPPGPHAGGGQHRSPRLNRLLHELRPHELQPTRLAIVTTTPVSMSNFFVMAILSRGTQVLSCFRSNSR